MNEKIKHIAIYLLTLIFFVYSIGLEIHRHKCTVHKADTVSIFTDAQCPCHHNHCDIKTESDCRQCQAEHSKSSHKKHIPKEIPISIEVQEKCCVEFTDYYSIDSGFVINYFRVISDNYQPEPELIPIIDLLAEQMPKEINNTSPPITENSYTSHLISYIHKASASAELPAII